MQESDVDGMQEASIAGQVGNPPHRIQTSVAADSPASAGGMLNISAACHAQQNGLELGHFRGLAHIC